MSNIDKQALPLRMRNYLETALKSGVKLLHLSIDELEGLLDELEREKSISKKERGVTYRVIDQLSAAEKKIAELNRANSMLVAKIEPMDRRIAELEARTVALPKPHAHLIWIQAGYPPDDYWDDVAVSHSEKDKCCDGSDRYPVYAHWEIEEALTAAGISIKGSE